MTHPAAWVGPRLRVLTGAAQASGLGDVSLVPEPVAAAAAFTSLTGCRLPPGRVLVVYDLGAGTFDVAVVRRTPTGFTVVATDGLVDVGGLDLDAAVVAFVRSATPAFTDVWQRLDWPQTVADRRARAVLWHSARAAKEQLSRHAAAGLHVPLAEVDLHLTRDEFEQAARPYLDRTVALTVSKLRAAAVTPEEVGGVFLVGGASRIPLTASLLHRALRVPPTVIDRPEIVVAEGSLHAVDESGPPVAPSVAPKVGAVSRDPDRRPPTLRAELLRRIEGHTDTVWSVAFSPDGATLVTGSADHTVRLWQVRSGRPLDILRGHTNEVYPVTFSPDGALIASGGRDVTVRLWDAGSGREVDVYKGTDHTFGAVRFSPNGAILAAGADGVRCWHLGTGQTRHLHGHTEPVWALAFHPTGGLLASGSDDRTVRLWEMPAGRLLRVLHGHDHNVVSVAFSPDGTILATASADETARLWHVATGTLLGVLKGHMAWLRCIAFGHRGTVLATTSDDGTARLWDVTSGRTIEILSGHDGRVHGLAFSPDGGMLATSSDDRTAQLWSLRHHG